MRTPWGQSDHQETIADGIISYSTPGHGGYWLSAERRKQLIPAATTRNFSDGPTWWEEDCDWAVVFLSFPNEFAAYFERGGYGSYETNWAAARKTCESYHPEFLAALAEAASQPALF